MTTLIPEQFDEKYAGISAAMREDHIYCVYNDKGRLVFLSPTVSDVLGYSVDEFKQTHWAHMVEDTMSDEAEKHLERSLSGETAPAHPVCFEHKNGGHVLMEAWHWPVFDDSGKVSRIEGFLRDVTAAW